MAGRFKNTLQRWLHAGSAALALDLALIAALAAAAAYGTWVLLAPRAKAAPALGGEARALEAPSPAARRLFGAAAAPQAASSGAVRLIGLISPSQALFSENGRPRAAAVGVGRRAGGAQRSIDHVVVSRRGELERLVLERRSVPLDAPGGARGNAGR
jgi:hypothetical protein